MKTLKSKKSNSENHKIEDIRVLEHKDINSVAPIKIDSNLILGPIRNSNQKFSSVVRADNKKLSGLPKIHEIVSKEKENINKKSKDLIIINSENNSAKANEETQQNKNPLTGRLFIEWLNK